jgi:hypothetical protein
MVKYFKLHQKFIGEVKQDSRTTFYFDMVSGESPEIKEIKTSCGCSAAVVKGGKIKVTFKANFIPLHLKHQGYYTTEQSISVEYKNGEKEYLRFSAKIIQ